MRDEPQPAKPAAARGGGWIKKLVLAAAIVATAAWIIGLVRLLAPMV